MEQLTVTVTVRQRFPGANRVFLIAWEAAGLLDRPSLTTRPLQRLHRWLHRVESA